MSLKPIREQIRENSVKTWMLTIVRDGGVARCEDLRIDKIDETWKPRECWFQNGLEAFRIALMLRDRYHFPFTVALGFSLESGEHFAGEVESRRESWLGQWTVSRPTREVHNAKPSSRICDATQSR